MTELDMKRENEKFFINVINKLSEGGIYVYPERMGFFTKRGNKLYGEKKDLDNVRFLVTREFFESFFSLK